MMPLRGGLAPLTLPSKAAAVPGWWLSGDVSAANCKAAYAARGAASLAASYTNLANPGTNNAAPGTAPTWNATDGWIFTVAQYLTTGIIPANGYSMIIRYTNWGAGTYTGHYKAGARFDIGDNANAVSYNSGGNRTIAPFPYTSGTLGMAGQYGFRNGAKESMTAIPAWTATATTDIWVGGLDNLAGANFSGKIQAIAIYNSTLTDAQMLAVHNAMIAL